MSDSVGASDSDKKSDPRFARHRNPSFPYIALRIAEERVQKLIDAGFERHPARFENVVIALGYPVKSSAGLQTIAALKAFGLISDTGKGASRKIEVTNLAKRLLKDKRPGVREELLRESALTPSIIREHFEVWGPHRPPDSECLSELTLEEGFNDEGAKKFLNVYDSTLNYAKVSDSNQIADDGMEDNVELEDGEIQENNNQDEYRHVIKVIPRRKHSVELNEDVSTIGSSQAILKWPNRLTQEDYEEFEIWLDLIKRKAKRAIIKEESEQESDQIAD